MKLALVFGKAIKKQAWLFRTDKTLTNRKYFLLIFDTVLKCILTKVFLCLIITFIVGDWQPSDLCRLTNFQSGEKKY